MNKQKLASRIWQAANSLRTKVDSSKYKDYILGFIFYKFLSERQEEINNKIQDSGQDLKDTSFIANGFFIEEENLFSTWLKWR
ncbi:type I restriction-modification system subunit M N-terminal domain-containing protein [Mycoplasma bradburyae]|uniref:type I restriction-modification system subunit M N-terminal domain-containing protein n=1 Tax=Mycoplasma bradburyae TaxID=2963128 RepID=UPI0023402B1B|nr:type I restriction-modification system subunit M N-terminal domain-containing protein [Mycoplasma bradburyae]MDC4184202.1 type I restriction-modification system subunit M N-terminal domain-containing protein [Mycoplasma bradburyae]